MTINIVKAGLADALYDGGRYGYQHLGINPGGAMDTVAMQVANALVVNAPNQPVLEMHFPAATLQFNTNSLIALSGADFAARINQQLLPINTPIAISAGSVLMFSKPLKGARCYMAVYGGFAANSWLGSYSTNLVCNGGGYNGRNLTTNDVISIRPQPGLASVLHSKSFACLPFSANVNGLCAEGPVEILPGQHYSLLTNQSNQQLRSQPFTISADSNRMGYRLQAEPLQLTKPLSMLSSAVTRGTMQLLPNGQLIVLMADHQTTGGYPVVGHVTSASFSALAQYGPSQQVHFQQTDITAAEAAIARQRLHLLQLQNACTFQLKPYLHNANR